MRGYAAPDAGALEAAPVQQPAQPTRNSYGQRDLRLLRTVPIMLP
jgi:hypothetical protein